MKKEKDPIAHLAKLRKPKSPEHLKKISEGVKRYWSEAKQALQEQQKQEPDGFGFMIEGRESDVRAFLDSMEQEIKDELEGSK